MGFLRYTSHAQSDFAEIAEYIARDNPVAAYEFANRLEQACESIGGRPDRGFPHEDLPAPLLVVPIKDFLIVYRVDDLGVVILRCVHGARDLGPLFPGA